MTAEPDAGDVETLTEAERRAVVGAVGGIACNYGTVADLHAVVGRIVAARVAAARADERERIARVLVAHGIATGDPAYLDAACIVRESAGPRP